jgi:SAM-dependent methyltransferase
MLKSGATNTYKERKNMSAIERLRINQESHGRSEAPVSASQLQTRDAFSFQWAKRDTYESKGVKDFSRIWLFERYCGGNPQLLSGWLAGDRKIILDAGCGAGFSALLFFDDHLKNHDYLGVDISNAVDVAADRFREQGYPGDFLQINLLELPLPDESIDIIFSEGVLHHTDSTERAFKYLAGKLKPGGRFLFYVYAKKAVIREFTDDYIRDQLKELSDEEAWHALEPLTKLGIELGEKDCEIDVSEDIPFLGIKKGRINLQRFFYWHICKLYYRPDWSLDEMNHINYDWFRPFNCLRHTPEEVTRWAGEANLFIERMDVQDAGITVVARKNEQGIVS